MQLAQDQCGQSYPDWGWEKKMGKMGLVTRWLKTNFGKISKLVRQGKEKVGRELGRDGWDWAGCDQG